MKLKAKLCPVCGSFFKGKNTTCSNECAESFFADAGDYRTICFRHHPRHCIICQEENVVEVHHLNGDHNDDRPENLVPLCPTHHRYWHSTHRHLIEPQVDAYIKKWMETHFSG